MTWTLSELASIAEILGVIAIFSSLIFVGIQLNRSNREARAATIQATLSSENQLNATILQYASTWDKLIKGETLSEGEEARRAIVLMQMIMADSENRFYQFKAGLLDPKLWGSRQINLVTFVNVPAFKMWRISPGALNRSPDFLELLDKMVHKAS